MEENKKLLLKNYLSNIQVNLTDAAYTHCWAGWKDTDYIPEYNKFYFICDGEGWLKISGREFYPGPGQMFLMPAGVLQSYSSISNNPFTKFWCHFTAKIGDMNLFDIMQLPLFINVDDKYRLECLFKDLIQNHENHELVSSLRVKSILLEIIAFFIENTVVEKIHLSNSSSIEKLNYILNYIEMHLAENVTVEELSKHVHLHPNYFIRFFKTQLGSSPMHYINKMRLEKAKSLLKLTGKSVKEIANETGFSDLFYFSKVFKSHTGYSPSEFRNIQNP